MGYDGGSGIHTDNNSYRYVTSTAPKQDMSTFKPIAKEETETNYVYINETFNRNTSTYDNAETFNRNTSTYDTAEEARTYDNAAETPTYDNGTKLNGSSTYENGGKERVCLNNNNNG